MHGKAEEVGHNQHNIHNYYHRSYTLPKCFVTYVSTNHALLTPVYALLATICAHPLPTYRAVKNSRMVGYPSHTLPFTPLTYRVVYFLLFV
jgi:hypothetical protein